MTPTSVRNTLAIAATVLLCLASLHAQTPASTLRNISGTVTASREPLRGVVVELHNTTTNAVVSRLTDASGHYEFKRQDSNTDFAITVTYRGHASRPRNISKFDSHLNKRINFALKSH